MIAARGGARSVYRRRLETAAIVLVVAGIVASLGSIGVLEVNVTGMVYEMTRSSMGDVMVVGVLPQDAVELAQSLEGVAWARASPVWFGVTSIAGDRVRVPLVGESLARALVIYDVYEGRSPMRPGEAVFYHSLSTPPGFTFPEVRVGDRLVVHAFGPDGRVHALNLTIVGLARGYAFLGGAPYSLVVGDGVVLNVTGGRHTMLSVGADPGTDLDWLRDRLVGELEAHGAEIVYVFVNKREENPVVAIFESAASMLGTIAAGGLALAAILPAALGAAQVAREAREIAVLKAIGAGAREIAGLYALPWAIRVALGAVAGGFLAPLLAKQLLVHVVVGDSRLAEAALSFHPFDPAPGRVAETVLASTGMGLLGALVPLALALRVEEAEALHFTGLRGAARLRVPAPSALHALILRGVLARPWRLLAALLALAVIAGVAGGASGLSRGVYEVSDYYEREAPADVYLAAYHASPNPPEPMTYRVEALASMHGNYTVYDQFDYVNGLGMGERFRVKTYLAGDPRVDAPLLEGRYPGRTGEAVVTKAMARLLNVGLGDTITVNTPTGGRMELVVVGITRSWENLGYLLIVSPQDYEEMTGRAPGVSQARASVSVTGDPGEAARRMVEELEADPLVDAQAYTRSDLAGLLRDFAAFVSGALYATALTVAALGLIALAGIILVDVESRMREYAVLHALGVTPVQASLEPLTLALASTILGATLATPLAAHIAGLLARESAPAIGYVEPILPPILTLDPPALTLAALTGLLAWLLALWRLARKDYTPHLRGE